MPIDGGRAQWYLKGLILPGERKSVEPMAARVCPDNVRSAHQSMHHLVAAAGWSDRAVLTATARRVMPELLKTGRQCWWILDDTSHVKKGRHSVGVARQYCGRLGKQDNCQVGGPACRWPRCAAACRWIIGCICRASGPTTGRAATRRACPRRSSFAARARSPASRSRWRWRPASRAGIVLGDAGYGNEAAFRDWLSEQALPYVAGCARQHGCVVGRASAGTRQPTAEQARQTRRTPQAGGGARRSACLAAAELAHGELA